MFLSFQINKTTHTQRQIGNTVSKRVIANALIFQFLLLKSLEPLIKEPVGKRAEV